MQRITILEFKHYRHLKLSSVLVLLAVLLYLLDTPPSSGPYGGTVLGYGLGIVATLLVLLLLFYGVRKRLMPRLSKAVDAVPSTRKTSRFLPRRKDGRKVGFTLQGWLSAHVYWGGALVILATLHTGFQFGWNLHSLSYVLMLLVVLSGLYGTYAYLHLPRIITENMNEETLPGLLAKIEHYDKLAESSALQFSDEICELVAWSRHGTRIGGSVLEQLTGRQKNCPTSAAVRILHDMGKEFEGERLKTFHDLYTIMAHKEAAVLRARRDIKYKARLELWLYVHAPLSIAFLMALTTHILAIFFYW